MKHELRVWKACIANCVANQMEYRADFVGSFIVETTFQFFTIIFFEVIFGQITNLGGWSRADVYVFLGSVLFVDATIMVFFFKNLVLLPSQVNTGALDFYILKPIDVQLLISLRHFSLPNVVQMFTSAGLVVYGLVLAGWSFELWSFLLYLALLANGVVLVYGAWLCFQSLAFWLQAAEGFEAAFMMFANFYQKPDVIFKGFARVLFTFVMPAVVIASFPSRVLLGKELGLVEVLWCFAASILVLIFSRWLFMAGIKHYESASS